MAGRREAAEEALAARSAQREELSRRCLRRASRQPSGSRYRAEAIQSAAGDATSAPAQGSGGRRDCSRRCAPRRSSTEPDTAATARIAALEAGARRARPRPRGRARARARASWSTRRRRPASELERQAELVRAQPRRARQADDARVEQCAAAVRDAERAVEGARREAARVGGELAAVNQFLRNQSGWRRRRAVARRRARGRPRLRAGARGRARRPAGAAVVDRPRSGRPRCSTAPGRDGGRALVVEPDADRRRASGGAYRRQPAPSGCSTTCAAPARALALARGAARATPGSSTTLGGAPRRLRRGRRHPRAGASGRRPTRELRQAPAVGEERVLAERNRRERAGRARARRRRRPSSTRRPRARAAPAPSAAERRGGPRAGDRRAPRRGRGARRGAEEQRRIAALIERRRAAPDDGPNAGPPRAADRPSSPPSARCSARAERERAERTARIERLRAGDRARRGAAARRSRRSIAALERAGEAIAEQLRPVRGRAGRRPRGGRARRRRAAGVRAAGGGAARPAARRERGADRGRGARSSARATRPPTPRPSSSSCAARLELEAEPASEALAAEEREALAPALERLARRREQLGPVNPLAQEEYAEALEHVEELETPARAISRPRCASSRS